MHGRTHILRLQCRAMPMSRRLTHARRSKHVASEFITFPISAALAGSELPLMIHSSDPKEGADKQ